MKDYDEEENTAAPVAEWPSGTLRGIPSRARERASRAWAYAVRHRVRSLACAAAFLVLALAADLTAAFFLTFALVMLLMELDGRIAIAFFMISIATCSVLLAVHENDGAKETAIWAYFFLVIGVAALLASWWRERRAEGRSNS